MKIVKRKEFLTLPENTLYLKVSECNIGEMLEVKVSCPNDGWGNDWITDHFFTYIEEPTRDVFYDPQEGDIVRYDDNQTVRDGLFDGDEVMFAVLDNEDINQVINKLKKCLKP